MIAKAAHVRLRGARVVLREKRISDARNDYAWSTDLELSRLDAAAPLTLAFEQARMLYEEELAHPAGRRQRFAIDTVDGEHIGNCMIYDINEAKGQAELGIMIGDRRYWGKTYGTDAVRTLLRHVFRQNRLQRIYLHTLDWNKRAQKSFQKAGFAPTGLVTRNGHTFIAMEIWKSQWEKAQAEDGAGLSSGQAGQAPG